jgi:TolA-binding protein
MAGKIVLTRRVNLYFISGILLFSIIVPVCLADEDVEINKQKENILSLIDAGKFSDAKAATAQMTIKFPGSAKLPDMLYWIAGRFQTFERFEDAKQIQEQIIRDFPDSPWAEKARMGNAMTETMSLIVSGKYAEAKAVTAQMATDFAGSPDMAEILYWISGKFQTFERFEDANQIQKQIIRDFPESPWAEKARMGNAMTEAMLLIVSGKYAEAKAVTDKMSSDFAGNPDLAEILYWISGKFQTFGRFQDAKQVYEQIIKNFPDSTFAKKAMASAMTEAMSLVMSGKYPEAKVAIDKMAADFAGNPDLPEALFWITDKYEHVGKYDDAKRNYQLIAQNFPNSPWAGKAKLGVVKENVISLINSKDYGKAKTALNNMITDFNDYKELPEALYWINESYELSAKYDEAEQVFKTIQKYPNDLFVQKATLGLRRVEIMRLLAKDNSEAEDAINKMIADFKMDNELPHSVFLIGLKCINDSNVPNYLQRALTIFEKVINDLPRTSTIAGLQGDLYFYAGRCCDETELYPKALTYFQKIVDSYPDFTLSWYARFKLGSIPQKMKEKGTLNPQEADKATKDAYKQLLIKYPDCPNASTAKTWLSENVKEG